MIAHKAIIAELVRENQNLKHINQNLKADNQELLALIKVLVDKLENYLEAIGYKKEDVTNSETASEPETNDIL